MASGSGARPRVLIAGAGIAGMTAALHLLEAGFEVTILEKGDHVGGKFGATPGQDAEHEHAYHFLGDWCVNLWSVIHRIGLRRDDDFLPSTGVHFLRPRDTGSSLDARLTKLSLESLGTRFTDNIHGGVIPPNDMILWFYSLLELMADGRDLDGREFLNRISVNGFMRSLPYMTDLAALLHQEALVKAFSIPSYETSARSYRRFARFFSRDQGGWVLNQPVSKRFWPRFTRELRRLGRSRHHAVEGKHWPVRLGTALDQIRVDATGPRKARASSVGVRAHHEPVTYEADFDYLLVTLPPWDLASVVERSRDLRTRAPGLLELRNLRSRQMASLDVYFKRPLAGIPSEHVTLIDDGSFNTAGRDDGSRQTDTEDARKAWLDHHGNRIASRFALSFVDNYQIWNRRARKREETWLNVISADFDELKGLPPGTANEAMLDELRRYLEFSEDDIDRERTALQLNEDLPLMMNTVGSWQYRPSAGRYKDHHGEVAIENLYLAGDYCRSAVDIVSLEGAVMTARIAARHIAEDHGWTGRVPREEEPAEVSQQTLDRLKQSLEPWLRLAARGSFGRSRHPQRIGVPYS